MTNRKTDGERIAEKAFAMLPEHHFGPVGEATVLAKDIDRLVRKRMAEAWEDGWRRSWETPRVWTGKITGNPYRGSKHKD